MTCNRKLWLGACAVCVLTVVTAAFAQISPVRLKVTKNMRKDMEKGATHLMRETVTYTVEVANASTAPVNDIVVRWAVLITPGYRYTGHGWMGKGWQVVDGVRTCSVDRIQKYVFDTEEIEIAAYSKREYHARYKSDIAAYYVEALVNGAVVASEVQPSNAKFRIEEEKAKQEKTKPKPARR